MPEYALSKAAEQDLEEIYRYSFMEFGEQRADAYFEALEGCLQRLAEHPTLGMGISTIRDGYLRFVHQRHLVYYKTSKRGIFVSRILGPGMSPGRNLP